MEFARQALLDAVAVVPHTDADGLAAGAIALRARGEGADAAILLGRGRTPFEVSAYGEQPEVSTAPLMRRLVPAAPPWLAAVGAVGDLGDAGLALPECAGAAPKSAIRELVALVNAPRRLPDGPVGTALALLVEHDDPGHDARPAGRSRRPTSSGCSPAWASAPAEGRSPGGRAR